jgi:hypothetical protein
MDHCVCVTEREREIKHHAQDSEQGSIEHSIKPILQNKDFQKWELVFE